MTSPGGPAPGFTYQDGQGVSHGYGSDAGKYDQPKCPACHSPVLHRPDGIKPSYCAVCGCHLAAPQTGGKVVVTPGKGNLKKSKKVKRPANSSGRKADQLRVRTMNELATAVPGSREQWEADTPHVSMNDAITQTEQILADAEVDADASSRALQQVCEQLGINAPANLTLGVAVQEALGIRHFSAEEETALRGALSWWNVANRACEESRRTLNSQLEYWSEMASQRSVGAMQRAAFAREEAQER